MNKYINLRELRVIGIKSPWWPLVFSMFMILVGSSPAFGNQSASCANPILEIGSDGSILSGSKKKLISVVQNGEPIRVGWDRDFDDDDKSDLSHWSDAQFLSVFAGEVATQVQSIHRQTPSRKTGNITLPSPYQKWHGLLDSKGVLRGRLESSATTSERVVHSVWCYANPQTSWNLVYRHDLNGNPLQGSKSDLLDAIRGGQPLQVGWGLARGEGDDFKSVEHVVSPIFTTITDKTEVTVQMPEHIGQLSYWDVDRSYFDDGAVMWRGLATTQGQFDAIWVNRSNGKVVRRSPQRAAFSWFIQGVGLKGNSLATKNGVIADKSRIE